ncbi:MAG: hypothetical protein R2839_02180 [Thermomicrobiales bacterium]
MLAGSLLATLLLSILSLGGAAAQDEATPEAETTDQTINIELILDASGSMAEEIEPGVTRIDAAKQVLNSIIDRLPQDDNVNIGLRVYGHKGANNESGRAESCLSTDLKVPVLGVDLAALKAVVDGYEPVSCGPPDLALSHRTRLSRRGRQLGQHGCSPHRTDWKPAVVIPARCPRNCEMAPRPSRPT